MAKIAKKIRETLTNEEMGESVKNIRKNRRKCNHEFVESTELVKHVFEKTKPISNSRVESLNDFEHVREVRKKITTPVIKCMECGEIMGDNYNRHLPQPTIEVEDDHNVMLGYNDSLIATGSTNILIGENAISQNSGLMYSPHTFKPYYAADYKSEYTPRSIIDTTMKGTEPNIREEIIYLTNKIMDLKKQKERLQALNDKVQRMNVNGEYKTNEVDSKIERINDYITRYGDHLSIKYNELERMNNSSYNLFPKKQPYPPIPQPRNSRSSWSMDTPKIAPEKDDKINAIELVKILFSGVVVKDKVYDDIDYIDFIFYKPINQDDTRLDVLENGDVLKWEKVPTIKRLGILSPKVNAIKAIRIKKEVLEEARKKMLGKNESK